MADRIGNFNFIRLEEPPEMVHAQIKAHTRPGTDGVTLHDVGVWGEPFEISSLAGALNMAHALNLYAGYLLLIGGAPVQVTWAGFNFTTVNHRFYVINVQQPRFQRLILGTGPTGDYFAEVEARWTLQSIYLG